MDGAPGQQGDKGDKGDKGDTPAVRVTCDLSADGRTIRCTISAVPPSSSAAKLTGTARLAGSKRSATRSGRGRVTVKLRSAKRLKKAPRVILRIRSGKHSRTVKVSAR
jgi:hypothetical protein